jgi:AcrR family transcriptional regulator
VVTVRAYRSVIRERSAALTRNAILSAAEELFAKNGYTLTTVSQVADAAEVAANTVYTVFGGKAALVVALADRGMADPVIGQTLDGVRTAADGVTVIRAASAGTCTTARRQAKTIAILHDNVAADPLIAEAAGRADGLQRDRLSQIASRLAELGALRDGTGQAEAADILWYYLGHASWRMLRRMGWTWQRCEAWLNEQVSAALLHRVGSQEGLPDRRGPDLVSSAVHALS